jgi:hypothetical protein
MKRYLWFAAAGFLSVSLIFAQGVGTENNGASPGGNRTGGTPPDTPDGHVVTQAQPTAPPVETTPAETTPKNTGKAEKARKVKKAKLDPKIVARARATPEHGKNAVPSDPPATDPHEQPAK